MERILIKHISGSRANQIDVFLIQDNKEIRLGRDLSAEVKFDPDRDDQVSRMHARISQDPADKTLFTVTDLESRNGTFVNKTRILGKARLYPGDRVQLGAGGPEVEFDLDPRPVGLTRLASPPEAMTPRATRHQATLVAATQRIGAQGPAQPPAVGRATVERLIAQTKGDTRKHLINGGAVLVAIVVLVAGLLMYRGKLGEAEMQQRMAETKEELEKRAAQDLKELAQNQPTSAQEIVSSYGPSTVFIEASWKLIYTQTGGQIYHAKECVPIDAKRCKWFPAYILLDDRIEPLLSLDGAGGRNTAIGGGGHTGSGFVVQENGFILTNRHVAATWETRGDLEPGAGVAGRFDTKGVFVPEKILEDPAAVVDWVPSKSRLLGGKPLKGKTVEGRHDYLDVTFPKSKLRIPARLVRVSDTADVALIKIDVPTSLKAIPLGMDDPVSTGENITVLGYPGVSPDVAIKINSYDPLNREAELRIVPDLTVTGGLIGKIIRGQAAPGTAAPDAYYSFMGDVYQLTVNATGAGNSGGPVFNGRSRVIGIFTYGKSGGGAQITFAVPIKHGMDIMTVQPVIN
ncbi:MAG: trypsin-like peptidase domain-containing protein [Gammaproteobacteria bacterium]